MGLADEPASRTGLGKWKPRQWQGVKLMFPVSFSDLHEPRGDPVQRPFNQSRYLQPGGHAHPHADRHPALGEALPSLSLPFLPVHSKWGSARPVGRGDYLLRKTTLLPILLTPELDDGELVTHERQLKVLPTWRKLHSCKEGVAFSKGIYLNTHWA